MDERPRKPEIVLQELSELRNVVDEGRAVLGLHPEDPTIQLLLGQDESRLKELSSELADSYAYHRRHVLKLVFKNVQDAISLPVEQLSSTLMLFNKLMDRISTQVLKSSKSPLRLNFATSFAGSVGIMMNTDYDPELVSQFETVAARLFDYLSTLAATESKNLTSYISINIAHDKYVVRALRNFFKNQSEGANDIQLEWGDLDRRYREVFIDHEASFRIFSLLGNFETFPEVEVTKIGRIRGVSLVRHSIEFQPEDDHRLIRAHFDKKMDDIFKAYLDERVRALLLLRKQLNDVTDEIIEEWRILAIEEMQTQ